MSDLKLLVDLHKNNYRQGPGSDQITEQVLDWTDLQSKTDLQVADIGCGTGASTFVLANKLDAKVTAVDLFPGFLDKLQTKAKELNLDQKISTKVESMDDLSFAKDSLDLILSEGAIYNIGFQKGLEYWHQFLKTGGFIAISEIIWLSEKRPEEIQNHWQAEYPEIDTLANKIKMLETSGFSLVNSLVLPKVAWLENYYQPLEKGFAEFLNRNNHSKEAQEILKSEETEIKLYHKYSDYFSYGYFLARKN
jgi:cyclopropane fatty-acyl-phospholipid synthase-like methyltransferase